MTLLHLTILSFFFAAGIFVFSLYLFPSLRVEILSLLLTSDRFLLKLSFLFAAHFFMLLLIFRFLHRRRMVSIPMKMHPLNVDAKIIGSYVAKYFKQNYPQWIKKTEVYILPDQKIEIGIYLSGNLPDAPFYESTQAAIGKILADLLDYDREFYLTLIN